MVITGGSSGIGAAIVQKFLALGYSVFNLDIVAGTVHNCDASAQVENDANRQYHHVQCDVSNYAAVKSAIESISSEHEIEVLVCNAGKHLSATIENTSEEELLALFNLNVKGAVSAIQSSLPSMKSNNFGRIILVASDQAIVGKTNSFAYNLTKHALASIAKTTALDYADYGITANAVCPGTIDTPLYRHAIQNYCDKSGRNVEEVHIEEAQLQPVGRIGLSEEVAEYVSFLAKKSSGFITGSLQIIDGGYTAR